MVPPSACCPPSLPPFCSPLGSCPLQLTFHGCCALNTAHLATPLTSPPPKKTNRKVHHFTSHFSSAWVSPSDSSRGPSKKKKRSQQAQLEYCKTRDKNTTTRVTKKKMEGTNATPAEIYSFATAVVHSFTYHRPPNSVSKGKTNTHKGSIKKKKGEAA